MIAILVTRCGCTRRITIPDSFSTYIKIPLSPNMVYGNNINDIVIDQYTRTRTFVYERMGLYFDNGKDVQVATFREQL